MWAGLQRVTSAGGGGQLRSRLCDAGGEATLKFCLDLIPTGQAVGPAPRETDTL
jgi:hypothetical protein